ncbi:MAG: MarR family transcriptional regulator [Roseburia inulinivorans]
MTAKLKAKGPAVSRTLKTLEDKGYIERDVNKADRRNTL